MENLDIFVLNPAYTRIAVIDTYESFIWTERYREFGDFNLVAAPTRSLRLLMKEGNYLAHAGTKHVMFIETVNIKEDPDGSKMMTVSGRTLNSILETRSIGPTKSDLSWVSSGAVSTLARRLVDTICVTGALVTTYDIIPDLIAVNEAPTSEIIDVSLKPQSLYSAVKDLLDSEKLGFEITLEPISPRLKFRVYKGIVRPNVVFSSSLDNLTEESHLMSTKTYRNIAYVWGLDNAKNTIVAAPGTSLSVSGFARRVMYVDASDIDPLNITDAEWDKALKQRGVEALAANRRMSLFDAELTEHSAYTYEIHYSLGDTVTFQDDEGTKKQVMITEYIWASDAEGLRSYPTFEAVE